MNKLSSSLLTLGLTFATPNISEAQEDTENASKMVCKPLEGQAVDQKGVQRERFVGEGGTVKDYITAVRKMVFRTKNGQLSAECLFGKKVRPGKSSDEKWGSNSAPEELLEVTVAETNAYFIDGYGPFNPPNGIADVADNGDGNGRRDVKRQLPETQKSLREQFTGLINKILAEIKKVK